MGVLFQQLTVIVTAHCALGWRHTSLEWMLLTTWVILAAITLLVNKQTTNQCTTKSKANCGDFVPDRSILSLNWVSLAIVCVWLYMQLIFVPSQ